MSNVTQSRTITFMEFPSPADLAQRAHQRPQSSAAAGDGRHQESIRSFAFFGYKGDYLPDATSLDLSRLAWSRALASLAALAEPEDWAGTAATERSFPILDSYVRYTFQRLVLEDKVRVSSSGEFAAFNTGLLTQHAEEVFGVFQRNTHVGGQPWKFRKWATESDRDILLHFPSPPEIARYATTPSDLVYDVDRELKLAYEHILGDNLDRFPEELASVPRRARQSLDHAVDWALKRTRRNYKIVVPQWYPRLQEGGAQFLMPLDLRGTGTADLALVVSAVGNSAYRGNTVLTLNMAYTNARLVSRPDSDWLTPQALPEGDTDE